MWNSGGKTNTTTRQHRSKVTGHRLRETHGQTGHWWMTQAGHYWFENTEVEYWLNCGMLGTHTPECCKGAEMSCCKIKINVKYTSIKKKISRVDTLWNKRGKNLGKCTLCRENTGEKCINIGRFRIRLRVENRGMVKIIQTNIHKKCKTNNTWKRKETK